jgi:Lrp/AsnC family transcriptional regulator, leucine-responsive regulatory protein
MFDNPFGLLFCRLQQSLCRVHRQYAVWRPIMDERDRLLLAILRKDGRRPVVALARDLGLSRTATQDRLGKLVTSGAVKRFTIIEGEEALPRQTAHLLVKLEKGYKCAQIVPRLRKFAAATTIHSIAGAHDILVRLDAAEMAQIEAARSEIAASVGIAEVTTMVTLERHSD